MAQIYTEWAASHVAPAVSLIALPAWQALRLAAFRPTMWVMMWVRRENNNKRQQYQRRFADVRSVRATFNNHQNQSCEDRDG